MKITKVCEVCGGKFHGSFKETLKPMNLCVKHLHHMVRHGKIIQRTRFNKNEIINHGLTSEILLYNRKGQVNAFAVIDSDCVGIVSNYKWTVTKKGKALYVKTDIRVEEKRKTLYLPNLILGYKPGYQIDHISGDPLDNRRENLRFVTQQQNLWNRSDTRGYSHVKGRELWHTYIEINGKRKNLGCFKTEEEAKATRRAAELKYYGEFAPKRN